MATWRWSVQGQQASEGTLERSYEDSGTHTSEHPAEVLSWLVERGPIWDNLDTDQPFTISLSTHQEAS